MIHLPVNISQEVFQVLTAHQANHIWVDIKNGLVLIHAADQEGNRQVVGQFAQGQAQALAVAFLHPAMVLLETIIVMLLDHVEGKFRLDQGIRFRPCLPGIFHIADRNRKWILPVLRDKDLVKEGKLLDLRLVLAWHKGAELIPAVAADDRVSSQHTLHVQGQGNQDLVANRMPMNVIDLLKVVNIQHHEEASLAQVAVKAAIDGFVKAASGQKGSQIVPGRGIQHLFLPLTEIQQAKKEDRHQQGDQQMQEEKAPAHDANLAIFDFKFRIKGLNSCQRNHKDGHSHDQIVGIIVELPQQQAQTKYFVFRVYPLILLFLNTTAIYYNLFNITSCGFWVQN